MKRRGKKNRDAIENLLWVGIKRKEKKGRNDRKFSVGGYKEKRKRKGETIESLVRVGIKRKGKEREKR